MNNSRRQFLKNTTAIAAGFAVMPSFANILPAKPFFQISLAQWSLHKEFFSKKYDALDFPVLARKNFDIGIVEYVNTFFKDKATDKTFLAALLQRCKDNNVKNHLIMIDGEGDLGNTNDAERAKAIGNHYKWVDAANYLGCKTIRVNAYGKGSRDEVKKAAIDGLSRLGEFAAQSGLNVIVENHGSYSSDGDWLLSVMQGVNRKNVGILPDFGNFCIRHENNQCAEEYDKYKGTEMWMPYAKGVSAKTFDFDAEGNCIETDYPRIMKIIKDSGFKGIIGIEYEGSRLPAEEGVKATKALLLKTAKSIK
ncbi:sugar phosphate isomerase/epimerase family protein [Pseudoflavitalea rhizosphaerae]|uniref:sugar phosphate isomerase/epimerase family protein n=1 Tax=Pseudoflavitalea rhizosphaerae TaxID=1884793 RepID=UPI000F8D7F40|nr:sugar phosphate isomerase/epimerase family protein [Pseudoflavitalea rhizosphaerae]